MLSWATEAGTPTIDNGVGPVPLRGTIKVTPKATTTYTLTMAGGVTRTVTVLSQGQLRLRLLRPMRQRRPGR